MEKAEFERLRDRLSDIFAPVKFRLAQEVYDWAAFGSMYALWTRGNGSVRVVWDGKDFTLVLEALSEGVWEPIAWGTANEADEVLDAARVYVGRGPHL